MTIRPLFRVNAKLKKHTREYINKKYDGEDNGFK